jgi:hypothetical protein
MPDKDSIIPTPPNILSFIFPALTSSAPINIPVRIIGEPAIVIIGDETPKMIAKQPITTLIQPG